MLPTETSRKLSDLLPETRAFQSSKPWCDPIISCQHVTAGVELCLYRDEQMEEPWGTSLTSARSIPTSWCCTHQPGQISCVTWGARNGTRRLHWGHWTAQEMSQSLNRRPQGYSLCTIRGAGYPGWSVGMDRFLWRSMRAGADLHCSWRSPSLLGKLWTPRPNIRHWEHPVIICLPPRALQNQDSFYGLGTNIPFLKQVLAAFFPVPSLRSCAC